MFLAVKLTHSCFKERNHPVHPFARPRRAQVRYRQRLLEVTIHYDPTVVDIAIFRLRV
jgi:hypothetical protein